MRTVKLGVVMSPRMPSGGEPLVERVVDFAQRVEALGFEGLWVTDSFGRGRPTIDPLILLAAVCGATKRIELGTCVVQLPLRHPVEHAHCYRVQALNLLSNGRLPSVSAAARRNWDFDAVQADFEQRYKTLPAYLEVMRRVWNGDAVFGPALTVWPGTEGGPQVLLGAWRSARWIRLAAEHCQGWISSGAFSSWDDVVAGMRMYRAAGGKRAVIANILTDLRPQPEFDATHANISLVCNKAEARERLRRLEDLGVDDALLIAPFNAPGHLEEMRGLGW